MFLTAGQVAELLQVSEKSVLRWAAADPTMPALRIGRTLRFDRARLLAVSRRVARLAEPRFLATLGKRLAGCVRSKPKLEGFDGDVLATAGASEESRVVLLGAGKTTVSGRAALVIDLGGDDLWKRAAGRQSVDDDQAGTAGPLAGCPIILVERPGADFSARGIVEGARGEHAP